MSKFIKRFKNDPFPELPLPRLQMTTNRGKETIVTYSLFRECICEVEQIILNTVTVGEPSDMVPDKFYIPWRAGADMIFDMYSMKMRGFLTNGKEWQERFMTSDEIPAYLYNKMYPKATK